MTIVFGTPVAAIMLALELLLFEWTPRSLLPVATACVVADILRSYTGLPDPLFPFTGTVTVSFFDAGMWVLVGICAGLLSGFLTRLVYALEDGFHRLPIHWMWWPALGAVVVGIGGLIDPNVLGLGYANIEALLRGDVDPGQGLSLLVVKTIVWSVALGSGTSGGTLAPLMMIGGAMAAAAVTLLPAASPGFWPLLAMAATLGGTLRLPLTATFFALGVTGNIHALLPLIVCCFTAHTVTVLLMRRDILTEKVARRGHHVTREWHADPFALAQVKDIMVKEVETVPATMTLHAATSFLTKPTTKHPSFPVVDAENHVLGILNPPTVLAWRRAGKHRTSTLAELLAEQRTFPVTYPDWYLENLVEQMTKANIAHVPVVSREDQRLVGYIAWKDVLNVRSRRHEAENRRVAFHGVRNLHTPS
jgi:CBS domain-containing protein